MSVFLRNLHPTKRLAVPLGDGWARIVPPQACAAVPSAALASPRVQHALADQRLAVVTEVNANADSRNALALRTDLALAIAQAERRAFARLIAQAQERGEVEKLKRGHYWSAEQIEGLRHRIAAGATMRELATEHGLTRQAIGSLCRRYGLKAGYAPRGDRRPVLAASGCQGSVARSWPAGVAV